MCYIFVLTSSFFSESSLVTPFCSTYFFKHHFARLQICPLYILANKATDGTQLDLNIGLFRGFGGLIQGQIYNHHFWLCLWLCLGSQKLGCLFLTPKTRLKANFSRRRGDGQSFTSLSRFATAAGSWKKKTYVLGSKNSHSIPMVGINSSRLIKLIVEVYIPI